MSASNVPWYLPWYHLVQDWYYTPKSSHHWAASPGIEVEGRDKMGRISQHFYVNVNRDPDRDGFCQRISRQTSQLVGSGHHTRRGRGWAYYPVPDRRHSANVQYGDEIFEKDQMMGTKGGKSVLHIIGIDKRPKCQPIGAQIDCRCGGEARLRPGGWCALWQCEGLEQLDEVGRWSCVSWC